MMTFKTTMIGQEQLYAFLRGLGSQLSHPVVQAANVQALKPFLNKAHRLAPVGRRGKLADSIGTIKTPFAKAGAIGEVQAGPRRGKFGGSHAHWIEFGTGPRKFRGANRGAITKKPFLEPAWQSTQEESYRLVVGALQEKVFAYARRTIKNA